jgi:hypothetical protein
MAKLRSVEMLRSIKIAITLYSKIGGAVDDISRGHVVIRCGR